MNPLQAAEYIKQHVTNDHVRLQIEEVPELTQGFSSKDNNDYHTMFNNIQSPYAVYEVLRKASRPTSKLENPKIDYTDSSIKPTIKRDSEFVTNNLIYKFFMNKFDPSSTLLLDDSLDTALSKFKNDLADGLSNELQYYKLCGFSKRKTCLRLDALKDSITNPNGHASITNEIFEYIAKRFKVCICILFMESKTKYPTRCDYIVDDNNAKWILIDKNDIAKWPIEFDDSHSLSCYMRDKMFPNLDDISHEKMSKKTVSELKEIAKYFGIYKSGLTKDGLVKVITQM